MAALVGAGCSEARIDASSPEKYLKSIEHIHEALSETESRIFAKALAVMAADISGSYYAFEEDFMLADLLLKVKDHLEGQTAPDIIAQANNVLRRQLEEQRRQIETELEELRTAMEKQAAEREKIKLFEVERSRFFFRENSFITEPVIELTVRNGTSHAVSRAHFVGFLQTPGRSVPWVHDEFHYRIRGGLEPGESDTWSLAPNMYGEWGRVPKDRDDMVLTVTPTRIDGPDGEPLFDTQGCTDDEYLERIKALEEGLKNLAEINSIEDMI